MVYLGHGSESLGCLLRSQGWADEARGWRCSVTNTCTHTHTGENQYIHLDSIRVWL